jgi:hypothetical protein
MLSKKTKENNELKHPLDTKKAKRIFDRIQTIFCDEERATMNEGTLIASCILAWLVPEGTDSVQEEYDVVLGSYLDGKEWLEAWEEEKIN